MKKKQAVKAKAKAPQRPPPKAVKSVKAAKQGVNNEMVEVTLTNEEKVNAHLNPTTSTGRPAQVEAGSVQWQVQSGDCTVQPADDGMSCYIISGDNPGDSVIMVSADADLGQGVQTISDILTAHVTGAQAANVGLTVDAPEAK